MFTQPEMTIVSRLVRAMAKAEYPTWVNSNDRVVVTTPDQYWTKLCLQRGWRLYGESYFWTTPSGKTRINHPGAYKWPKVYVPSTRCIEVCVPLASQLVAEHQEEILLEILAGAGRSLHLTQMRKRLRTSIKNRVARSCLLTEAKVLAESVAGLRELNKE